MPVARNATSAASRIARGPVLARELERFSPPSQLTFRLIECIVRGADEHSIGALIDAEPDAGARLSQQYTMAASGGDVGVASRRLDPARVVEAALAAELADIYTGGGTYAARSHLSDIWLHNVAVANAARQISHALGMQTEAGKAFVAGLLHDIGLAALAACVPKAFDRVLRQAATSGRPVVDVEHEALEIDHTVIGRRIAAAWGLPAFVQECAWLHHHPQDTLPARVEHAPLVHIVAAADELTNRQRIGFVERRGEAGNTLAVGEASIEGEALERIVDEVLQVAVRSQQIALPHTQRRGTGKYPRLQAPGDVAFDHLGQRNGAVRVPFGNRAIKAIADFAAATTGQEAIEELCRRLAGTACAAFAVTDCVALAIAEDGQACAASACGEACHLSIAPPRGAAPHERNANCVFEAPAELEPLVYRFRATLGHEIVLFVPIASGGRCVGGVLFADRDGAGQRCKAAGQELRCLTDVFAMATASAMTRQALSQAVDELTATARRVHARQPELLRSRSLSMIAQMAAGAAHELNNPLAVIAGRAQMLQTDCTDENAKSALHVIDEQAQRASRIVLELMGFAKPDPPQPAAFSVVDWADQLKAYWLRRSTLSSKQIIVEISDPSLRAYADLGQVDEAARAIVANAVEAMSPKTARLVVNSPSVASDEMITVSIGDNGVGMKPEVLEHALDPFYSHRPAGRGRGLGLSRAARLVENNGGRLWLESSPGGGTRVFLSLPARATR